MPRKQAPKQAADTGLRPNAYTLREAAGLCGVSRGTVRRYLDEGGRPGRFPNAFQDADGVWRIPVPDLIAAGLKPGKPTAPDSAPPVVVQADETEELRRRVAVAERETEVLRAEVERLWGLVGTLTQAALPARSSGLRGLFRRRGAES